MAKTILNSFQRKVLQTFKASILSQKFYLSGGTALAEYYLQHRLSEDLDFFTQQELNLDELKKFINLIAKRIKNRDLDKIELLYVWLYQRVFLLSQL